MEDVDGWRLHVPASYDLLWTAVVVLVVVVVLAVVVRLVRGPRRDGGVRHRRGNPGRGSRAS